MASEFVLIDDDGRRLARLGKNEFGEASLELFAFGSPRSPRIEVRLGPFGTPQILLYDDWSADSCSLMLTNEGKPGEPYIRFAVHAGGDRSREMKLALTRQFQPLLTITVDGKETDIPLDKLFEAVTPK